MKRGKLKPYGEEKDKGKHKGGDAAERGAQTGSRIVGGSRDMFEQILKQRGEFEILGNWFTRSKASGVGSLTKLIPLLEKPREERTVEDLMMISDELRQTKVFEQLKISPDMEMELARIADVRNYFIPGGIVVREQQLGDCFYCILEGCCVFQRQALGDQQLGQAQHGEKMIIVANIVEASSIAAADSTGTSDPFVTVKIGTTEKMTECIRETLHPIWDCTIQMEVPYDADCVEVQVWDNDAWGDNDFLGLASVTINKLKIRMHKFNAFNMKLEADPRYEADADEGGVSLDICGTISFHLKLTTEEALKQCADQQAASAAADIFVSGDSFGAEEVREGSEYPYTVIVEQPSVILRVSKTEYDEHILPMQMAERDRKYNFFQPISPFSGFFKEEVLRVCDWFKISTFRAGEVVSQEGMIGHGVTFLLSGDTEVVKRVWSSKEERLKGYRQIMDPVGSQIDPESPTDAFMALYEAEHNSHAEIFEGVPTAHLGWITPGMTINLQECLSHTANTYSAIARTPVECLVSAGGSVIDHNGELLQPVKYSRILKTTSVEFGSAGNSDGDKILTAADFAILLDRIPLFPHEEELATQYTERKDWQKYKQTLVSNIIYQKRRELAVVASGRQKFNYSNLIGEYTRVPRLPPILKPQAKFHAKDIEELERLGDKYDPDEGSEISFKQRLHNAASPTAKVYSYQPPSYRPPSSYGSYSTPLPRV